MIIKSTKFKDLKIIVSKIHNDKRGHFREIFKKNILNTTNLFLHVYHHQKKMF